MRLCFRSIAFRTIALLLLCNASVGSEAVLTNADIVRLSNAGLSERVITTAIQHSRTSFDTSVEALIALRKSGVPPSVLQAMIGASQPHEGNVVNKARTTDERGELHAAPCPAISTKFAKRKLFKVDYATTIASINRRTIKVDSAGISLDAELVDRVHIPWENFKCYCREHLWRDVMYVADREDHVIAFIDGDVDAHRTVKAMAEALKNAGASECEPCPEANTSFEAWPTFAINTVACRQ